jgi:N-acetylmuramoyl-L-alanine amidase
MANVLDIKQCFLVNNDCYKQGRKIKPSGIVVHSTGANNPYLKRNVQPDDGILGVNMNNNHWNRNGVSKCVHAVIGKDDNGNVRLYQTLPRD